MLTFQNFPGPKNAIMKTGSLYLIPSFLAETNSASDFPAANLEVIAELDNFIVENVRTARRFLRKAGYTKSFDEVTFFELNKHTDRSLVSEYLKGVLNGENIGLLSEAGVPCVADPGSEVVMLAHNLNINVFPLTGPSSILLALMASGLNGQNFIFHGYLPIERKARDVKIKELEKKANQQNQSQIIIETPYRNKQVFDSIIKNCNKSTRVCIAMSLTHKTEEFVKTRTVSDWKKNIPDLHKKPTVFIIG